MFRTLTRKVTVAVAVFMALLLLVTANTVGAAMRMTALTSHLTDHTLAFTRACGLMMVSTARAMIEAEAFIRTGDSSERDEAREALEQARGQLARLKELDHSGEYRTLLDRWQSLIDQNVAHVTEIIAASERGDQPSVERAFEQIESLEDQFAALGDETNALLEQHAQEEAAVIARRNQYRLLAALFGLGLLSILALLTLRLLRRHIVLPISKLSQTARSVARGDLDQRVSVTTKDEIGDLQQSFNQMISSLRDQQDSLAQRNADLEQSMAAQQHLVATVNQLSTPLLPVLEGVLLLPLVGHVDSQRADSITQALLRGVSQRQARTVILDVTGIAAVDSHVMQLLLRAVRATELLGAQVWMVGITAAMAQMIVAQGVDIGSLKTYRDIGTALQGELVNVGAYAAPAG